ncbi:MAG: hypothetical protein ACFCU6_00275 [Balneolaceae bacterium]
MPLGDEEKKISAHIESDFPFADELHFRPWLGERDRIMKEIFEITTVNLSILMRYASRRNRKSLFKEYIPEIVQEWPAIQKLSFPDHPIPCRLPELHVPVVVCS